ncbi:GntR family transcriptional regulator [Falsiroseomonas oryzae]|uniref:GntR family transcriptional regulator n=1 Tax=Falsiroseomonas oryzae TaxID=2766473 RepID=UPI0022EAAD05|nr:GntR family transcriptional regulator [Roseomonas sp. MO-31]
MQEISDDGLTLQVHRRLRADLLNGRIAPGSKLKVQAIGAAYGAGASPVREALSSLAAEGLVQRIEGRGFRAAPATVGEFDELVRARCWLEEVVLRESLSAGDAAWEEALVVAQWRLRRLDRGDAAWEAAHAAFHRALLAACPSSTLRDMAETLRERAERYRALARPAAYPGRDVGAEHHAIAETALARHVPRAIMLLKEHYERTADFLRTALAAR